MSLSRGHDAEEVARELYEGSSLTLTRSREIVKRLHTSDFTDLLEPRKKTGSAENPVTKLFPAAVTERQFLDEMDRLREILPTIDYRHERFSGHTLVDFTILENELELPINVKNAGTRFENAGQLVGLDPDDCITIPAYKAHDAVEKEPNLLYAISIDYGLIRRIESNLLTQFNKDEAEVWRLLNEYSGTLIRDAEDKFIYSMVNTLRLNTRYDVIEAPIEDLAESDIRKFVGSSLNGVDLLIGGPPCQPFSKSAYWSKGDTLRLEDPRSNTLREYFRVVQELRPRAFLLENVHGISYSGKEEDFPIHSR